MKIKQALIKYVKTLFQIRGGDLDVIEVTMAILLAPVWLVGYLLLLPFRSLTKWLNTDLTIKKITVQNQEEYREAMEKYQKANEQKNGGIIHITIDSKEGIDLSDY